MAVEIKLTPEQVFADSIAETGALIQLRKYLHAKLGDSQPDKLWGERIVAGWVEILSERAKYRDCLEPFEKVVDDSLVFKELRLDLMFRESFTDVTAQEDVLNFVTDFLKSIAQDETRPGLSIQLRSKRDGIPFFNFEVNLELFDDVHDAFHFSMAKEGVDVSMLEHYMELIDHPLAGDTRIRWELQPLAAHMNRELSKTGYLSERMVREQLANIRMMLAEEGASLTGFLGKRWSEDDLLVKTLSRR